MPEICAWTSSPLASHEGATLRMRPATRATCLSCTRSLCTARHGPCAANQCASASISQQGGRRKVARRSTTHRRWGKRSPSLRPPSPDRLMMNGGEDVFLPVVVGMTQTLFEALLIIHVRKLLRIFVDFSALSTTTAVSYQIWRQSLLLSTTFSKQTLLP